MSLHLKDKVAIVTGSRSGLGEAIAKTFASQGARVTLCGRDQERLKSVLDKVVEISGGHHNRFLVVQGDLNELNVRKDIIAQTVDKFGCVDILVANAGVTNAEGSLSTATEASYNNIFDTNLKSVFFLIQEAVPYLEKSKGNIINISSNLSSFVSEATIYSMSKVALDHLTRCLAVDLGSKGIRVNGVNPGHIPTRILRRFGADIDNINKEIDKTYYDKVPLRGRRGTSEDVSEAVLFLASDSAGFITGENIKIDGGRSFAGPLERLSMPKDI